MECEQLIRLIKEWYLQVKQETMAPARMMRFVDQHVKNCPTCAKDLMLSEEVEKIREFIFPESKIITPIQVETADKEDSDAEQDDDEYSSDNEDEDELDEEAGEEDEI
ncbi:MAG: hypothetical protein GX087_05685 [Desulfobulbaceae bacterium]|nr:hypothetical protein [Desulfobulbaceae bacterium]